MRQKFNKQAFGAFLLLGMLMIGIVILSGCIGQEEESKTGIPVTLTIQPNPLIPTRTTSYTLTDYRLHTSWANAITNDGNGTIYLWIDGTKKAFDRIFWEWDVGYPGALKQLTYEVDVITQGTILEHSLSIYKRDGSKATVFNLGWTNSTNGTRTWNALSNVHWINGKVYAHYEFEEEIGNYLYSVDFDVMILEFNQITEEHLTTQQIIETEIYDVLLFTVKQNDVDVTISGIPTNYQLNQITPEDSYLSVSNNIDVSGKLTIEGCSVGTYKVIFKSTKAD